MFVCCALLDCKTQDERAAGEASFAHGGCGGLFNLARSLHSLRHSPLASLFCEASETARAHETPRQRLKSIDTAELLCEETA